MGSLWVSLWDGCPYGVPMGSLWVSTRRPPPRLPSLTPPPPSWGEWLSAQGCPRSSRIVSFRLRVEPPRGLRDDTAANDASFVCSDGTVLEGGGGDRGLWGNWSDSCPPSVGVCGLRTRVEAPQRTRDDTGLNSAVLLCCS
uniref:Uncharacterized protein n=1 Tax=Phasianus colchicus TaxID=9054 RepID=A0A669QX97_PHACC